MTGTWGERVSGISSSSGSATGRGLLGDPVRLVRGDQVDPPLGAPVEVHAGDQVIGVVVLDEPGDEVQQAAYRVHRGAVRGLD